MLAFSIFDDFSMTASQRPFVKTKIEIKLISKQFPVRPKSCSHIRAALHQLANVLSHDEIGYVVFVFFQYSRNGMEADEDM